MIIAFHLHRWSKWEVIEVEGITRHGVRQWDQQERRCESCGKTERKDIR
jgi:hypothetical protein